MENNNKIPESSSALSKEEQTVKNLPGKKIRPSVFIGSARESHDVAEFIQQRFNPDIFEVDTWQMSIFGQKDEGGEVLKNAEQLKNFTDIYDFAIFVFSPDDQLDSLTRTYANTKEKLRAYSTRHNVVFEFGLFLGRLGAERSFILYDEHIENFVKFFFTDLAENLRDGEASQHQQRFKLETHRYKAKLRPNPGKKGHVSEFDPVDVAEKVKIIQGKMSAVDQQATIGFLPSTSLAKGYFNNFLGRISEGIARVKYPDLFLQGEDKPQVRTAELSVEQVVALLTQKHTVHFRIVVPDLLQNTRYADFQDIVDKSDFVKGNIPTGGARPMSVYFKASSLAESSDEIFIYDIPSTMSSSLDAIDMTTSHKDIRELLAEKERRNFIKAIQIILDTYRNEKPVNSFVDIITVISWTEFTKEISRD